MRMNSLKPAEKIQFCRRTGSLNTFSSMAEHRIPGPCLPADMEATGDAMRMCNGEQPSSVSVT